MTYEECCELGIMTDQELKEMDQRWERIDENGIADTQNILVGCTIKCSA